MSLHPLISYALVAHFDIDKGSILKHSYPDNISVLFNSNNNISNNYIAELMLPEGAHLRPYDWTYFILDNHKDYISYINNKKEFNDTIMKNINNNSIILDRYTEYKDYTISAIMLNFDSNLDDWIKYSEKPISISFKIEDSGNYIYMEYDNKHIKSLLITEQLSAALLQPLFISFYTLEGNAIGLIFPNDEYCILFQQAIEKLALPPVNETKSITKPIQPEPEKFMLYGLSMVQNQKVASVRRGAVVYALALVSHYRFVTAFKNYIKLSLEAYFANPELITLQHIFDTINTIDVNTLLITQLSPLDSLLLRTCRMTWNKIQMEDLKKIRFPSSHKRRISVLSGGHRNSATQLSDCNTLFDCPFESNFILDCNILKAGQTCNLTVPLYLDEDELCNVHVTPLINRFKNAIMLLYNALLTEKRVIIIGHNQPAADVCEAVIACIMLLAPPLPNSLRRVFPYCTLTNLDFMKLKGYVAGVTNPIFAMHPEWWDLMLDLNTNSVTLSPKYAVELEMPHEEAYGPDVQLTTVFDGDKLTVKKMDYEFISELLRNMEADKKKDELWVRAQFYMYSQHLASMAMGEEEFNTDYQQFSELDANAGRINAWKRSDAFSHYINARNVRISSSTFSNVYHYVFPAVRRLQVRRPHLFTDELAGIFDLFLDNIYTYEHIKEFISFFHDFDDGILPVAMCLFHQDPSIRVLTARLMRRIDSIPEGAVIIGHLNYFILLTYETFCTNYFGIP